MEYLGTPAKEDKQKVIYARVSTRNQKDDLQNQLDFAIQCYGLRKYKSKLEKVVKKNVKKVVKIRFYPNHTQKKIIMKTLNACRFIRNLYIESNQNEYKESGKFITAYDFAKELTKMKKMDEYSWLNGISTKALKDACVTQEKAFKSFFKGISSYPHFISRKRCNKESFFFVKDNVHFKVNHPYRIKIPILGYIRITEKDYLPHKSLISSGKVIREYNKYYVMFIYDIPDTDITSAHHNHVLGIDLGIEKYATIYDKGTHDVIKVESFLKDKAYKKKVGRYQKLQRAISHKAEINYGIKLHQWMDKHPNEDLSENYKNIMKGESYQSNHIQKLMRKARLAYAKIINYRKNAIRQLVAGIVKRINPRYIMIENLSISEMISNENMSEYETHRLHQFIADSGFYMFRQYLKEKCEDYDVQLRVANRYFPSSKTCSCCGKVNHNLTLSNRVFHCPYCDNTLDRDVNAAINLANLKDYEIVA